MNQDYKHTRSRRPRRKGFNKLIYNLKKWMGIRSSVSSAHHASGAKRTSRRSNSSRRRGIFYRLRRNWRIYRKERMKKRHLKKRRTKVIRTQKGRARKSIIKKYFPFLVQFGLFKDQTEADSEQKMKIKRAFLFYMLNSMALYIIAYLLVYLIYQLTVLIAASFWNIDAVLFYYDLAFNDLSPLWSRYNIIFVTFSGPFISLIIGLIFYQFLSKRPNLKIHTRLFIIWLGLHGLNLFFGAFASGVSFNEGFGYVPLWLFMNVFWRIFFSVAFLFILLAIGYFSTSKFLSTTNSPYRIRRENRQLFILSQAILPWFFGSLLIFLVKIPNNMPYETGNLVTMLFLVLPTLFNTRAMPGIKLKKEPAKQTMVKWMPMVIVVALIMLYRIGLKDGYHVVMLFDFALNISPL